ncbi:NEL-type E3 ubiquitin ligase domain-containing protein [Pseudomonas muyukensis]|uniref:NEL domain-containing protein n=1 Tax=Pseudomonas muyukensis TaxID=2842357 RepID=A0ABX8M685_9PSED|nr:NEL-type E3 ubiquitin ligase domain-containing protein [Pseudomonas muyukensis]QXH34242.1 hypothetical protein KSS95_19100 [Pseudomonas muyukensis]
MPTLAPHELQSVDTEQDNALDAFIGAKLPHWLKQASSGQLKRLREALNAHQASQARLRARTLELQPLQRFAERHFASLLVSPLPDGVSFEQLQWLTVSPEITAQPLPSYGERETRTSGLLRLMGNFAQGTRFYEGSGLVMAGTDKLLSKPAQEVVKVCRALDVGRLYQDELARIYNPATEQLLADDKLSGLRLATEMAALKGLISGAEQLALREVLDVGQVHARAELKGYPGLLQVLGQPVADGLLIHLRDHAGVERGVIAYLPCDPRQALRRYASSAAMNQALAAELKDTDYHDHFTQLVSLEHRAAFVGTLAARLQDSLPDLAVEGRVQAGNVFLALARQQVQRLKDDARLLLVPTADADAAAVQARHAAWKSAGLSLVNLAGLFIPVVGALLLAGVVAQTVGEVFEGVSQWSQGHQHEALEHMLGVAATLAATAATVAAVSFVRSAYLQALEWSSSDGQTLRLWSSDLEPYASSPTGLSLQADGRFSDGQRHWLRQGERFYEVHQPEPGGSYRLRHPSRADAYAPVVLHNGERCWQLLYQRVQREADAARMLDTLWPAAQPRTASQARQIMQAALVDEEALRGLLVENRRTPINLRDTFERFAADARVEAFFHALDPASGEVAEQPLLHWCLAQPQVTTAADIPGLQAELRSALFDHLLALPATDNELAALLCKAVPSLPEAYARALAEEVGVAQAEQALAQDRLPGELHARAVALSRMARLNRMLAGLYLRSAYADDTGVLALTLLDKLQPNGLRLSLSRDIAQADVLATAGAEDENIAHWVLVRDQGEFKVYDDAGNAVELPATDDLFAALANVLAARNLSASLQLEGEQAGAQLRDKLLAQLPGTQQGIARLLGWPGQHVWFNPGQRLADGRVGYLLSGRGPGRVSQRAILRDGLRQYFPGLNDAQLELELQIRWRQGVRVQAVLWALEDDLEQLTRSVNQWVGYALDDASRRTRQLFAERLLRAWRGLGESHMNDVAGQRLGLHLAFTDLPVATLPELPLQVDFFHVKALQITDTPISHVHAGFLRAFTDLQRLDLRDNHLLRCPDGLGYLINLRRLQLANNQIRLDAQALESLSRLPLLSHLDLSDNPLAAAGDLPFHHLPQLIELRLRRCGLRAWPAGIEVCSGLKLVDLRNNALRGVPEAILRMPQVFREVFLVDGNRLSMTELANLLALDPILEQPEYESGRAWWVGEASSQAERGSLWDELSAEKHNAGVFTLLEGLEQVAEYSWPRAMLERQVWAILARMRADPEFATAARREADLGLGDGNRLLGCFSQLLQLHAQARAADSAGGMSGAQLLGLGKGLFRLERLHAHVQADIQARAGLGESSRRALALCYRVKLRRALNLPFQPNRFYSIGVPSVSEAQVSAARDAVQAAAVPEVVAASLCRQLFWQRFLERYDAAAFAALAPTADQQPLRERLTLEFMQRMARIQSDEERAVGR